MMNAPDTARASTGRRIDLHTHSMISDGSMTPEELIDHASDAGLAAIALTDHDTVGGLDRAEARAQRRGIEFVPGVEISTEYKTQIHVLGYYIDRSSPYLNDAFSTMQEERKRTHERYLEVLNAAGLKMTDEEVRAVSGDAGIGRAHYARVMMDKGYVQSVKEAFDRYLHVGAPCYVKRDVMHAFDAIGLIHKAGGLAFFAHPHQTGLNDREIFELMTELKEHKLDGVEGYYSEYTPEMGEKFRKMASELGLLLSGGSDFHAKMKPHIEIGRGINNNLFVDYSVLEKIKKRLTK
ncbi:MAG: PHP domain-containing protein [Clostridia bacterium]|nr:PHP domain-containing protein [Clostridia bacterium]